MKLIVSLACIILLTHSIYCWFGSEAETTTALPPTTEQPPVTTTAPPSEQPQTTATTVPPAEQAQATEAPPVEGETIQQTEETEEIPEGFNEGIEGAEGTGEPSPLDGVDFYMYSVKNMTGNDFSLEAYRGYVTLVVNVASNDTYTDSTYKDLVALQTKFEPTGAFTVLGFPCNQFWEQESGTNEEILRFATETYNVNFPMFGKTDVHGDNATDAYHYLAQATGYAPQWNFWKYLVDHTGHVVDVWSHETPAIELEGWIEDTISKAVANVDGTYAEGYDATFNETEHQDHDHTEL